MSIDIRLGDVVISSPGNGHGGVYQYDYGKTVQDQTFQHTGFLNRPPDVVLSAVGVLESTYDRNGHSIETNIETILGGAPRLKRRYTRPDRSSDQLYVPHKVHPAGSSDRSCRQSCGEDPADLIERSERDPEIDLIPMIHYGSIASATQLMKDALTRDKYAHEHGILCFEMEAAGIMNRLPCLVIRGICDYSDSHKNKEWQGYAAMTAAAYTKDLLRQMVPRSVEKEKKMADALERSES